MNISGKKLIREWKCLIWKHCLGLPAGDPYGHLEVGERIDISECRHEPGGVCLCIHACSACKACRLLRAVALPMLNDRPPNPTGDALGMSLPVNTK